MAPLELFVKVIVCEVYTAVALAEKEAVGAGGAELQSVIQPQDLVPQPASSRLLGSESGALVEE